MTSLLRTDNITMRFGGVVAVNNLSIEVNEGEIVALIGPNGAGKTTTFNVITGNYAPTMGSVYYREENITGFTDSVLQGLFRTSGCSRV